MAHRLALDSLCYAHIKRMNRLSSTMTVWMLACSDGASVDSGAAVEDPSFGTYDVIYDFECRTCYGDGDTFDDFAGPNTWLLQGDGDGAGFTGLELETDWSFECSLEDGSFRCTQEFQERDWSPRYDALQTTTLDVWGYWDTDVHLQGELVYETSCEGGGCALLAHDSGMLTGFPCTVAHWSFSGLLQ